MLLYLLRKLLWIVPVLLASSAVTFLLMHAAPGSPWNRERPLDPELVASLNERYGLDQPLPIQYLHWLARVAQGDFGSSYTPVDLVGLQIPFAIEHTTVSEVIGQAAGPSLQLALMAFALALALGLTLGVLAAYRRDTWIDHAATGVALLGMAAPAFLLGVVLQLLLGQDPVTKEGRCRPPAGAPPLTG